MAIKIIQNRISNNHFRKAIGFQVVKQRKTAFLLPRKHRKISLIPICLEAINKYKSHNNVPWSHLVRHSGEWKKDEKTSKHLTITFN